MVYVLGMEIIEKLWYGSGVIHYLIKDHEYTSTYFPDSSEITSFISFHGCSPL